MYAVIGASGKVGYSTSFMLREAGVPVKAILRDTTKANLLRAFGCEIALADLQDPTALGRAIAGAHSVQVICPPVPQDPDTVGDMHRSIESIAEALEHARPDVVLAISDYGAHVREDIGMPTMFRNFEDRLRQLPIRRVFLRSAEHMEGWGALVPVAMATGILPTLHHPIDGKFPTISARDVGVIAADLLLRQNREIDERIVHAEGPHRYSAADVAAALTHLLGKAVTAQALPRSDWRESLGRIMSSSAADLLTKLYDAHNRGGLVDIEAGKGEMRYGSIELTEALQSLVPAKGNGR